MMYQKAVLFKDRAVATEILKTGNNPRKVKTLGRKVSNFSEATWVAKRDEIVRHGNVLKFTTAVTEEGFCMGTSASTTVKLPPLEGSLREMLLRTGDREIVEASPYDAIWGIGFTEANADENKAEWGKNLLGKALMEVRKKFREEEEAKKNQA